MLLGWGPTATYARGSQQQYGETVTFWVDLSTAGLIDKSFNTGNELSVATNPIPNSSIPRYFPQAAISSDNLIFAFAGGYDDGTSWVYDGYNYFNITTATTIGPLGPNDNSIFLPVIKAYMFDSKIDDGLPESGNVLAVRIHVSSMGSNATCWGTGGGCNDWAKTTWAYAPNSASCMDNNNTNGKPYHYSISYQNGTNPNCPISVRFQ